jgi:hypothetical protein
MTVWIGVDEAGYGPNLGPLVVCASVWSTTHRLPPESWIEQLFPAFRRAGNKTADFESGIVIDDSKLVYQSGKGIDALERNTLALVALCGGPTGDAYLFRNWLDGNYVRSSNVAPWCGDAMRAGQSSLRLQHCAEELAFLAEKLASAGMQLRQLAGRILFPAEFNRQLSSQNNKAAVLSDTTMDLVRSLVVRAREAQCGEPSEEIVVLCDKHGGRDRYFALLSHFFVDERIEIVCEGEGESAYRWRNSQGTTEIRFCSKAERFPPTAAASMTAKYVRELCMAEWNAFWAAKIPGLPPTAGYPVDAKRYRTAIEEMARSLGFAETDYWRRK